MDWAVSIAIISAAAAIASVVSVLLTLIKVRRRIRISVEEGLKPEKTAGLILLIGPSMGSAPTSIEYHLPVLRHCWLVGTKDCSSTAKNLREKYQEVDFYWDEANWVNLDEIKSTYDVISRIIEEESAKVGLNKDDIIADITGGVKPMTAGMTLACASYQYNMQYMKAPRSESGAIISGGISEPIKIDTTFKS